MDRSKSVFRGYEGMKDPDNPRSFEPFVLKNKYAALFTLLMRMRQACDHPLLVLGRDTGDDTAASASNSTKKSNKDLNKDGEPSHEDLGRCPPPGIGVSKRAVENILDEAVWNRRCCP